MIYLKLICMALLWGGTFIAGKLLAADVTPVTASFLRFALASVFLLVLVFHLERRLVRLSAKDYGLVVVLGITGIFSYNVLFFKGLALIEASRASLIIAMNPVVTFFAANILALQLPRMLHMLGVLLSVIGASIVITRGELHLIWQGGLGEGELYLFGCVLSWVAYALVGKQVMKTVSVVVSTTYAVMIGTLLLLLPALHEGLLDTIGLLTTKNWVCLFYLAFFGTVVGFVWFYEGVKALGPAKASAFVNLVPVFAVTFSLLFLREPFTWQILLGGGFIITGVYLTNLKINALKARKTLQAQETPKSQ